MDLSNPTKTSGSDLIARLGAICTGHGLQSLASRLVSLSRWVASDMAAFQQQLSELPRGARVTHRAAHHLLDLGGKHLRPMCVILAAKLGRGDRRAVGDLAMAVELVHSATLLHDDVVDHGSVRRGKPTSRVLYGNAASIFAGDWLLVQALTLIRAAGDLELLDKMLAIIDEMIVAESVQLENRGRINASIDDYFHVVEGKTAALFRWAMYAGARAGGLSTTQADALERFGLHLGVAFQAIDDLLDVDGDVALMGKALFTDLREGKMTYPLILAIERRPELLTTIARCVGDEVAHEKDIHVVVSALDHTGALDDCRRLAADRAQQAIDALDVIADGPGKQALVTVAEATIHRES